MGAHGVAMEGWYWRLSDPATGAVAVAILGVTRPPEGPPWGMVTLTSAADPTVHVASGPVTLAARSGVALRVEASCAASGVATTPDAAQDEPRALLEADDASLRVDLGAGARLDVAWSGAAGWPRRALGGVGLAHVIPGLSQYWHPWLLGADAVRGTLEDPGGVTDLAGARPYAEKNWGRGGMPAAWWWGQAAAFGDPDVCVCFAGGAAGLGPIKVPAGALVVRLGDELVHVVRPPGLLRTVGRQGDWVLEGRTARDRVRVVGRADAATGAPHLLPVPVPGTREHRAGHVPQHLTGELELTVRRGARTRFRGVSPLAGLERGTGI